MRKGKIRRVTNSSLVFAVWLGWARRVDAKRRSAGREDCAWAGIWRKTWWTKGAVT